MKYIVVGISGAIVCVFALVFSCLQREHNVDRLVFGDALEALQVNEKTIDFGTVPEGKKIRKVYSLQNSTDKLVRILKVLPSCACVSSNIGDSEISPGQTTDIEIEFDSDGRPGRPSNKVVVTYRVGNEEDVHSITLFLIGRVLPKLLIDPDYHDFGQVEYEKTYKASVKVVSEVTPDFEIRRLAVVPYFPTGADAPHAKDFDSQFSARYLRKYANGYEIEFSFTPKRGLPSGSATCKVVCDRNIPAPSIGFVWAIESPVRISPRGIVGAGRETYRKRMLIGAKKGSFLEPFDAFLYMEGAELKELADAVSNRRTFELTVVRRRQSESIETGRVELVFRNSLDFPTQRIPIAVTWQE